MKHVNMPAVSKLSPSVSLMTPVSVRLSLPNAASSAVKSRNSSAVESQSSLPVCGDSFFDDSDADHSRSNWSELSSFDVGHIDPLGTPSVLASSKVMRSFEVNAPSPSNVQRSQREIMPVTAASVTCSSINTWSTSRQPNTPQINSLPPSHVAPQKPSRTSLVAAATAASGSPSGLTYFLVFYAAN